MIASIATYSRFMRASMLEVVNSDYVRTARAKGLSERKVTMRHAFRNALIPLVTIVALNFGALLGGAVVTETVFALDGMGLYYVNAAPARRSVPGHGVADGHRDSGHRLQPRRRHRVRLSSTRACAMTDPTHRDSHALDGRASRYRHADRSGRRRRLGRRPDRRRGCVRSRVRSHAHVRERASSSRRGASGRTHASGSSATSWRSRASSSSSCRARRDLRRRSLRTAERPEPSRHRRCREPHSGESRKRHRGIIPSAPTCSDATT